MEHPNGCYAATVAALSHMTGREIADQLKVRQEDPSEREYRSWCNSIPILVDVIHRAGLDELTLILEYQTPIGSRIDAVLLGEGRTTGKPLVLVIELKQWSAIEETTAGRESSVCICLSRAENRFEERLHPVQQTLTYAKHLRMNHSNVADGKMDVRCRQFLHNFEDKEQLFQGGYQAYEALRHETYTKGAEALLAADLNSLFSPDPRPDVVEQFLTGAYVLGQIGFQDLGNVLARRENAAMLDDQIEVNRKICSMIDQLHSPQFGKHLLIISGPPGTGKTVVGLHAIYAYCLKYGPSWQNRGGCIFALPRSRTLSLVIAGASGVPPAYLDAVPPGRDLVVVDEAHRIEQLEATMTSLFRKANMVVVLQDDRQRIRLTEEGTVEHFRQFAQEHGIPCTVFSLASQKRAGYLGSYVSDLDKLFYGRQEQPLKRQSALELCCWDDLNDLDRRLHGLLSTGRHVKWYAPFCWEWTRDTKNRDIKIAQATGDFEKPWNPFPREEQYNWYAGEKEEYLDQVGCIYTAQGLEFDDTGVIWWDDLRWDKDIHNWRIDLSSNCDTQFMAAIRNSRASEREIVELVLNTYRVLLTRAKGSVHIWFRDRETREHVRKVMGF